MVLERPHAEGRLRSLVDAHALVFVQAPVGYGKTTLVTEALRDAPVAWYEAAPWDARTFAEPLVAAIRAQRPGTGRRTLALAEDAADPGLLGATLAAELGHLDEPLVLVIDDAHALDGDAFGPFIDALLRRLPRAVRIVVLSRTFATFGLAGAIAQDRAAILTAEDLRFDARDVLSLAGTLGVALENASVATLVARTDGWPAAIALALRVGIQNRAIPASDGAREAASALLVEQLVHTLPGDDVVFLEAVTIFELLDEGVLDMLGIPGAREHLHDLERRGAMVATLAGGSGFRVHPMLRDVLTARMRDRDAHAPAAAHVRAAGIYAGLGRPIPAMYHLEQAGDPLAMLAFLREHAFDAIRSGNVDRVAAMIGRVRGAGHDDAALFAYLVAQRAKFHGSVEARDRFIDAVVAADAIGDERLGFAARSELIEHDLSRGILVERATIDDLQTRALRLGPAARAAAAIRAGWFAVIEGRFADALRLAAEAPDAGTPLARWFVSPLRAYAHTALGEFEEAEATIAQLVTHLEDSDAVRLLADTLVWGARLALLRGDITTAWEYARSAQRDAEPTQARIEAGAYYVAVCEAATNVGDAEAAENAAHAALRYADDAWYAHDAQRFRAVVARMRARVFFLRGDIDGALAAGRAALAGALPETERAAIGAEAAWYALLTGAADGVALRAAARAAIETAYPRDAADAVTLAVAADEIAFIEHFTGERREAPSIDVGRFGALIDRRVGTVRFPLLGLALANDAGAFAAGLAAYTARSPRFEAMLAGVVATAIAGVATAVPRAPSGLIEPLTQREDEILALLVRGLTNKEIAQRLVVSPRTAETHVARILGKLGVNSRARAIAKAIALGLAPTGSTDT